MGAVLATVSFDANISVWEQEEGEGEDEEGHTLGTRASGSA
jgi:hypothetical protein